MNSNRNIGLLGLILLMWLNSFTLVAQTDTLCFNDTILYTAAEPGNGSYDWVVSGGTILYSSGKKDSVIIAWNKTTGLHSMDVYKLSENSCSSEPERIKVYVYQPTLDLGNDMEICAGTTDKISLPPDFEDYLWNGEAGTNEFWVSEPGSVKIEVKDQYGCWAEDSIMVTELKNPEPDFILTTDMQHSTVSCTNLSDTSCQFYWDFGDGSYSTDYTPEDHVYEKPGTYEISLTAIHGACSATVSRKVSLYEPVQADFEVILDGCAPAKATFINHSKGAQNYRWDFGNGLSSNDKDPVTYYTDAGTYEVALYAIADTVIRVSKTVIQVNMAPYAEFEADPKEAFVSDEIHFSNGSVNAVNWLWDFGDGETSDAFEPVHSYTSPGAYDISLSVWTESGCFDSVLIKNAITIETSCRMLFPTGFIPDKDGPSGGYYDPQQLRDDNTIFHPIYTEIENYELKIFNRWGELLFISNDITIGWDGYYKGRLAPQDTYLYEAKGTCATGEILSEIGSITLIY